MLNVTVLCIGKLKEKYWADACAEYAKRLTSFCTFKIVELAETRLPDSPSAAQIEAALKEEGNKILSYANGVLIPLCIEGREISSPELAQRIEKLAVGGTSSLCFVIGGSYGLSDAHCKR